jgi:hypothetical protein
VLCYGADSGTTFNKALNVIMKDYAVPEENILGLSLFASPSGRKQPDMQKDRHTERKTDRQRQTDRQTK